MLAHPENTAVAAPQGAPGSSGQLLPASVDTPRYVLSLTLPEFSMFNHAVPAGLARYGGSEERNPTISNFRRSGGDLGWLVSMEMQAPWKRFPCGQQRNSCPLCRNPICP